MSVILAYLRRYKVKLLLSLGHGSSAILVKGTQVACAYEEERLSKVKADSSYPKLAIEKILEYHPFAVNKVTKIYVSHWFDLDGTELNESKYFQPKHLKARFPNAEIIGVSKMFTHHDAHARSVWNFSGTKDGLTMVADGFGNDGETVTFYRDGRMIKKYSITSLGLLYQYATSYLGMTENKDEYKLLGYETGVTFGQSERMKPFLNDCFNEYVKMFDQQYGMTASWKDVVKTNKEFVVDMLTSLNEDLSGTAYFVQKLLEDLVEYLISRHRKDTDHILQFTGGIFYNVKLNNTILNRHSAHMIEFMPLAGDCGAPLGMVKVNIPHLFWGKREVQSPRRARIDHDGYEFVFEGNMEFGPRALGNTSCIAKPSSDMTKHINMINGRPNIMPMAPMISSEMADMYCGNINRLGKCKHFMIVAVNWHGPIEEFRGVLHKRPLENTYTCRPQVIDNEFTLQYGAVINTSLNAHGQPILYDMMDLEIMEDTHAQSIHKHS